MSIILKGIDLPSKGENVTIEINSSGYVRAYSTVPMVYDSDIQAIQIPKGHGRLIDIEKLKEEFALKNNICKECDSFKKCDNQTYSKSEICEKFIWAPTILEAEE